MQNGTFIRVFIASPGDVHLERDEACRVVVGMRHIRLGDLC